jgi:hypothetical protein
MEAVHAVALTEPEEDSFLLLPVFACFLLVVPFPYHRAVWELARFDEMAREKRARIMTFYLRAVQRHLFFAGPEKRLLSKNPSFTPFLGSLLETFPDARVLCCVRDPEDVVPSLLSSLRSGAELFGYDIRMPEIRDRLLEMLAHFSRYALSVLGEVPEDRFRFVPLGELKVDLPGFILSTYEIFGWKPDSRFLGCLREASGRDRQYASRHRYSLEEFGLELRDIRDRFRELDPVLRGGDRVSGS